jgi:hypothetical protein
MDRARARGEAFLQRANEAARAFIEAVQEDPRVRIHYGRGMRDDEKSTVLQQCGFPTTFPGLTFSFDVALCFAEKRTPGTDPTAALSLRSRPTSFQSRAP